MAVLPEWMLREGGEREVGRQRRVIEQASTRRPAALAVLLSRPYPSYHANIILRGGSEMLMVRDVVYCRAGKVRPMVEKFLATAKLVEENGLGKARVYTDVSAERYWTVVGEFDVESLEAFQAIGTGDEAEEFGKIWEGYHDLVDHGKREIYTVEG
jgi:hypothetical protein